MLVIFGFGHRTKKEFKLQENLYCQHCNNTAQWKLGREAHWFTLFFIPVFPFKVEYWMVCPICRKGRRLNFHQFEAKMRLTTSKRLK
ncbi:MAG: zinc ribbon domain-containing protein [Bacteroidales bacterium]|nr:zinc ribbon domain-containing protein [Bacteroidales bacterium]MCF8403819.1 zinc ribbon domain-containing protein [Bacteroidales bacterium]